MWATLFAVSSAVAAAAIAIAAYLAAARRGAVAERDRLQQQVADHHRQMESLRNRNNELHSKIAAAQTKLEGLDDKFRSVATKVLKESNEQFLQLARKSFEGEQKDAASQLEQRKTAIENLLKPIRETLDKYKSSIDQVEQSRRESYGALKQQLSTLTQDQRLLRQETTNLVTALRRPEVRGSWGQMHLRRVAELTGMVNRCDFTEEHTVQTEGSTQRPDMVVHLPSMRQIVVDAKTPIDAYLSANESQEPQQRDAFLEKHADQIDQKIKELSSKRYWEQFERSPNFVVLFIPGEPFLAAAAQRRPELIELAMQKNVVIATPSTLYSLLKTVALGWQEQRVTENAEQIARLGRELHKRISTLANHLANLGTNLEKAVTAYNQFKRSLDTRVLVAARRFEDLGAESSKELPAEGQIKKIEVLPQKEESQTLEF